MNEKTDDLTAMENSISAYRIKAANRILSSRTSLLCKRQIVDDYLDTYLNEYAAKARKELKTQLDLKNSLQEEIPQIAPEKDSQFKLTFVNATGNTTKDTIT